MAKQRSKGAKEQAGGKAPEEERTGVSASVRLDVATYAKVSAVAALQGVPKSTWMANVITDALQGIVLFDRKSSSSIKSPDRVDLSGEVDRPGHQ